MPSPDTLIASINPAKSSVAKDEMSTIQTLDAISDKALPILQNVVTVATVTFAGLFGAGAVALAGAGLTAFELGKAYLHNRADLNRELALYHKDIARVLGKPEDAHLTIQDMRNAADERVVGNKALKPLKAELEHLDARGKLNYRTGALRALITTAITGVLSLAAPPLATHSLKAVANAAQPLFYYTMFSFSLASMVNMAAEKMAWDHFDRTKPNSVYSDLIKLQKSSQQQPVTPQQVFEVILKADKSLASRIEQQTGQEYHEMTARNKERILALYAKQTHAAELAEHINNGTLGVTAIPLSVSGQLNWANQPKDGEENTQATQQSKAKEKEATKFVSQIKENRSQTENRLGMS